MEHADFKQEILKVCQTRGDKWAEEIRVRVHGAVSDLHAANARYHDDQVKLHVSSKGPTGSY